MDYKEALTKLSELRGILEQRNQDQLAVDQHQRLTDNAKILYGELEPIILGITGNQRIKVDISHGQTSYYSNYIESMLFSNRSFYNWDGHGQLLKVYGAVRRLAEDPVTLQSEQSITGLVGILRRFRECCQYLHDLPTNEKQVQDIVWIMLRSQFDRVERETTLEKFGNKNYRPDFGIPDLRILIEVKFTGIKTDIASIQDGILTDVSAYLNSSSRYTGIVVLVYDSGHKLRDPVKFVEDLRSVDGILDVLVVPGIG